MNIKSKTTIFLLVGSITALCGQQNAVLDSAVSNITKQRLVFPHEKIHLHTDKPYYITGEKIFFRAFLLEAFSNKPAYLSRYVYVELINPANSVVKRLKIRPDENHLFHGAIPLPEELPQGVYQLRAYTQYMRNQGESSFFSQNVRISDPQILSVQAETDFRFNKKGTIEANLRFINANSKEVIQPQSVTLQVNQDRAFTVKPGKDGWINAPLNVPDKATARALYVELKSSRHESRQYIPIPYPEGDFDVSFYPEGGHLIAGQLSNVAFKAVNSDGTALNITGEVMDSKGNLVSEFKTFHDGMGEFSIIPQQDEVYRAICYYGNRTLRFDLPEAQTNAFALKTAVRDDKLWITVNKSDSATFPELYLLIHCGGFVVYADAWDTANDNIAFNTSILPTGISHIVLLTKDMQIVSERLIFLLKDDNGTAVFRPQKDSYRKRERALTKIQLTDEQQRPLKGNFSIAVTNDREVVADSASGILSGILLRSELKGYIENPEYYFQKGNKEAEQAADLLMKTHGWTRYAIPDVVRGKLSYPNIPFETSMKLSGTVTSGMFSKLSENFQVSLLSLKSGFYDLAETDGKGRYVFQNFEFPDSTKFAIQALNSKGKGGQTTEVYVDEDIFPNIQTKFIFPAEKINPILPDYVAKANLHYRYENGMRMVDLPEVQVKANYRERYNSSLFSRFDPDYSLTAEEIATSYNEEYTKDLFYFLPGAYFDGSRIRIGDAKGPPMIIVDGFELFDPHNLSAEVSSSDSLDQAAIDVLFRIDINNIGQIDILKNYLPVSDYSPFGNNGVIVIYSKNGKWHSPRPSFNIKHVMPLGYQSPVEFYSPKYDTPKSLENSIPDLRTTIYWKPDVVTDDEGKAVLDFYTADDPSTYTVIIEGVSEDGKLVHYRGDAAIRVE